MVKNDFTEDGKRYILRDPKIAPTSDSFLYNTGMFLKATCRGYVVSYFMQSLMPTSYSHPPIQPAKTFILPEPKYYTHHQGRFFYLKDNETEEFFSAPFEPVRSELDKFEFAPGINDIQWICEKNGIEIRLKVTLPPDDILELWEVKVTNLSSKKRDVSLYPYFTIGFPSWMHSAAEYNEKTGGIIAKSITPYQKTEDYFKNKDLKDFTYLLSDIKPVSWLANQNIFEGDGGLHNPDGLKMKKLEKIDSYYENSAGILQFLNRLAKGESFKVNLAFGPAKDIDEILYIKKKYLADNTIEKVIEQTDKFNLKYQGVIKIETPDINFNNFINYWLPRQIDYHGRSSRLTVDPQTRNYLQDAMGMVFIEPDFAKKMFFTALSQQHASGEMPDGILLDEKATFTYINQVPHRDHSVWAALTLPVYINETGDAGILSEEIPFMDDKKTSSVYEHICLGLEWLISDRSEHGLSHIGQGDWFDPLNMAGYKGKGESGWLSEALSFALQSWIPFCEMMNDHKRISRYKEIAGSINKALNRYLWDGSWYAYGTTDGGYTFGVEKDEEGRIYLNSQSWALLCKSATPEMEEKCIKSIDKYLMTSRGPMTLAPGYTKMREDIGRLTQKFPGVAENGSIYCHSSIFYVYALYSTGHKEPAFEILRSLMSGQDNESLKKTEQLPVYIPNYYRGGSFLRVAGRSSHLPNTGTISWYYRSVNECLFGLHGESDGLRIAPQLPKDWTTVRLTRIFRKKQYDIKIEQNENYSKIKVIMNGRELKDNFISDKEPGTKHTIEVFVPIKEKSNS